MSYSDDLLNELSLPESCEVNTRVAKKTVLEENELSAKEKRLIRNHIEEITWLAVVKPELMSIAAFADEEEIYDEIHFLYIEVRKREYVQEIADLFQKLIPYPLLIWLRFGDELALSAAVKRINKVEREKRTITQKQTTNLIQEQHEHWNIFYAQTKEAPAGFLNLRQYYHAWFTRVLDLAAAQLTGSFTPSDPREIESKLDILVQIRTLETDIRELQTAIRQESQFNKRVEMNVEVKSLEDILKNLIDKL